MSISVGQRTAAFGGIRPVQPGPAAPTRPRLGSVREGTRALGVASSSTRSGSGDAEIAQCITLGGGRQGTRCRLVRRHVVPRRSRARGRRRARRSPLPRSGPAPEPISVRASGPGSGRAATNGAAGPTGPDPVPGRGVPPGGRRLSRLVPGVVEGYRPEAASSSRNSASANCGETCGEVRKWCTGRCRRKNPDSPYSVCGIAPPEHPGRPTLRGFPDGHRSLLGVDRVPRMSGNRIGPSRINPQDEAWARRWT